MAIVTLSLISFSLTACTQTPVKDSYTPITPKLGTGQPVPAVPAIYEDEVLAAQANHQTNTEVTCTLPVKRMLPQDNSGEKHEKFILQMTNGTTILVAHNISRAPLVPISEGDVVTVHGEYIWNRKGGVIHWTHISDTPKHPSGYIDFAGQRYQ